MLFNANPLMRFDGYYLLADLVDIPNLYSRGLQYLAYLGRKYALGLSATFTYEPAGKRRFVKVYGVCALVWRMMVLASIIVLASVAFMGAGIVVASLAAFTPVAMIPSVAWGSRDKSRSACCGGMVGSRSTCPPRNTTSLS